MSGDFISWGVGVNSTAIIALYLLGELNGKPEVVFADTGAELPETYRYFNRVAGILRGRGWKVTWLDPFDNSELYSKRAKGRTLYQLLWDIKTVPGIKWRFCTKEYKVAPIQRYAGHRVKMVGICADELRRIREDPRAAYPIKDYTREDCRQLISAAGLPEAHKTGCWICPFQSKAQWIALYDKHPDLWTNAVQLEKHTARWTYRTNRLTIEQQMEKWIAERDLADRQLSLGI